MENNWPSKTSTNLRDAAGKRFRHCGLKFALLSTLAIWLGGCHAIPISQSLPNRDQFVHDRLVIHSDFILPRHHRLLSELSARREDLDKAVSLSESDEPIHVYLFQNAERFQKFLRLAHPTFTDRRALFVQTDTELSVYALWGDRVGEDLRHEMTHGYLHSEFPKIPLWLDEGLAEYYELPRGEGTIHRTHLAELTQAFRDGSWKPNLHQIEQINSSESFTQLNYAEAWLWTNFLLEQSDRTRQLLREFLHSNAHTTLEKPLSERLLDEFAAPDVAVLEHLKMLSQKAN